MAAQPWEGASTEPSPQRVKVLHGVWCGRNHRLESGEESPFRNHSYPLGNAGVRCVELMSTGRTAATRPSAE